VTYTYPTTSNRLSSIATSGGGTRGLTYDAAGNVTGDNRSGRAFTYTYDSANRLASVSLGGVLQAEYKYNWLGQQVWRRLVPSNTIIHSVYGPDGNRIAEFNEATGALIREYVWFNGAPIAVIEGGVIYLVRSDRIGRPVFATTTSGTVVWRASYLPFGGVHVTTGAPIDARFPGQWFQTEAGLYQNWMRDYDPATGRYMQADPLGLVDGASVYGYARGNPGRWVDARGEATGLGYPGGPPCTCPPVPEHPKECSVDKNIEEARKHFDPHWFKRQVQNSGPWDYKQRGSQYQDFGNFNYGATGYAYGYGLVFPETVLRRMAGWAQVKSGTSRPEYHTPLGRYPYGDDPADQQQIENGMQYARCGCKE
jgi:RHS repeat-associated protein